MEEHIILVDEEDKEIGTGEKMQIHTEGRLHRAFSIFIFNSKKEWLLQKRVKTKYHSGGLWTNSCCGHPRVGETVLQAAHRRLQEEMGFDTELKEVFSFVYRVQLDHDLIEHEYNHVIFGSSNTIPIPNPQEVEEWKYIGLPTLKKEVKENPKQYAAWFCICFDQVAKQLLKKIAGSPHV